jgi:hypothetical protein
MDRKSLLLQLLLQYSFLLLSMLFAVAIGIRDFASFFFLPLSLRLHPSVSLSPLSVHHVLFQCPCCRFAHQNHASRIKNTNTNTIVDDDKKSLVWSFFVLYDSPAFSPPLALGFSANHLDPLLEKN